MIIKPSVRGFVCVTCHPKGCEQHVKEEIEYIREAGPIAGGPKNVLVIGASTGYGLSSRIVPTYAWGANTIGVFFERPSTAQGAPPMEPLVIVGTGLAGYTLARAFRKLDAATPSYNFV